MKQKLILHNNDITSRDKQNDYTSNLSDTILLLLLLLLELSVD